MLLTVSAIRRVGFTGEIALEVENLPPGMRASSGAILSEMEQGFITLTAASDAPLEHCVVRVIGLVKPLEGEAIRRAATPVEIYRIQNRPLAMPRSSIVVSVTEAPNVTLSVSPDQVSNRTKLFQYSD